MQIELCFRERYDIMPIYYRTVPGISQQSAEKRGEATERLGRFAA